MKRILWLTALGILALLQPGCGRPQLPLLTDLSQFMGQVEISRMEAGETRQVAGELTFHRDTGNLQFTQRGDSTVTLARKPDGSLGKFVDGQPVEPNAEDRSVFALIRSAVDQPPTVTAQVTQEEFEYRVDQGGVVLRVRAQPQPFMPAHGGGGARPVRDRAESRDGSASQAGGPSRPR